MEGFSVFAVSIVFWLKSRQAYHDTITSQVGSQSKPSNHVEELIKVKSNIPRVESEFSLGLNRSESIDEKLMEFGELCSSGQWAIWGFKYAAGLIAAYGAANYVYRNHNSSK